MNLIIDKQKKRNVFDQTFLTFIWNRYKISEERITKMYEKTRECFYCQRYLSPNKVYIDHDSLRNINRIACRNCRNIQMEKHEKEIYDIHSALRTMVAEQFISVPEVQKKLNDPLVKFQITIFCNTNGYKLVNVMNTLTLSELLIK